MYTTYLVRTEDSKLRNITLSAPAGRIDLARQVARARGETLNEAFRRWLDEFVAPKQPGASFEEFVAGLGQLELGPMPSRNERNAR